MNEGANMRIKLIQRSVGETEVFCSQWKMACRTPTTNWTLGKERRKISILTKIKIIRGRRRRRRKRRSGDGGG